MKVSFTSLRITVELSSTLRHHTETVLPHTFLAVIVSSNQTDLLFRMTPFINNHCKTGVQGAPRSAKARPEEHASGPGLVLSKACNSFDLQNPFRTV